MRWMKAAAEQDHNARLDSIGRAWREIGSLFAIGKNLWKAEALKAVFRLFRTSAGEILDGWRTFCPHRGALYSATLSLVPKSEGDATTCVVCDKVMDRANATKAGSFKLIHRPE